MSSFHQAIKATAVATVVLAGISLPAMADTLTNFSAFHAWGGNGAVEGTGSTAAITGPGDASYAPNINPNVYTDTANLFIRNGDTINGTTVNLGTLNNVLASGASFNASIQAFGSSDPSSIPAPMWDLVLQNTTTGQFVRVEGSQGVGTNTLSASGSLIASGDFNGIIGAGGFGTSATAIDAAGGTWADYAQTYGDWTVALLGVSEMGVVGQPQNGQAVIDSFTFNNADEVAAVPEPSTWAMMILGFFGVGFMAYRRGGSALRIV